MNYNDYLSELFAKALVNNLLPEAKMLVELSDVDINCPVDWDGSYIKEDRRTPLHWASKNGRLDIVEYLTSHDMRQKKCTNLNVRTPDGETPLHLAVESGNLSVVKHLISKNSNVKGSYAYGRISRKIDVNARDQTGQTALHSAAQFDSVDIVEYLAAHEEVDLHVVDGLGYTWLHYAVKDVFPELIECVVALPRVQSTFDSSKARDSKLTYNNGTILHFAVGVSTHFYTFEAETLKSKILRCVEGLLRVENIGFELKDDDGRTALEYAEAKDSHLIQVYKDFEKTRNSHSI